MDINPVEEKKVPLLIYHALIFLACALFFIIIMGTIIGAIRSSKTPLITLGKSGGAEQSLPSGDGINIFTGMGQLRIPLVNSTTLVISIAFPYPAGDISFAEELAGKITDFRAIAVDYFSGLPEDKIIYLDEETAKTEILRQYNAILRLGNISALYFGDMIILD